jgi:translation initiation factor 1
MSNPFSKLAALKDALPAGDPAPQRTQGAEPSLDRRFAGKLGVAKSRKGRGGKTVTAIRGLEASPAQLEELARELKKALGCGASVEGSEVLVQGEQEKRVAAWLEGRGAKRVILGT